MKLTINAGKINKVVTGVDVIIYENKKAVEIAGKSFKKAKINVFISYSHEDEDIKNKLNIHLSSLIRDERIVTWSDRQIFAGQEWDLTIKKELDQADLILLLISANFLASDYIWKFELAKALERHESGESIVIPIFCKPCEFSNMPFSKLQGVPANAKPISSSENIEQTLTEIVVGIKLVVDHLLKR